MTGDEIPWPGTETELTQFLLACSVTCVSPDSPTRRFGAKVLCGRRDMAPSCSLCALIRDPNVLSRLVFARRIAAQLIKEEMSYGAVRDRGHGPKEPNPRME